MSLQIITPPVAEPVTVDDVKKRLRLSSSADDAVIASHIKAARAFAEKISRRSLVQKSCMYPMDRFPFYREPIRVPAPPLVGVTAVKFMDSTLTQQTWDPAEYLIYAKQQPGLIVPKPGICYPAAAEGVPGAVEVYFDAGDCSAEPWTDLIAKCITDIAVFIYGHPGEDVPENLVQIPKIHVY